MTPYVIPRSPEKMGANEVVSLNRAYKDWCARRMVGLVDVDAFEFFCADQFLKPYTMSDGEIFSGLVDKSQDGGIDAFCFFLNRVLVDDTTPIDPRASGEIHLVIMQIKETSGFSPIDIDKIYFFTDDLLDLAKPPDRYHTAYHEKLSNLIRLFKYKYEQMSGVEQKVFIDYYFVTGNDAEPAEDAIASGEKVCAKAKEHFRRAEVRPFHFVNATRLYNQVLIRPLNEKTLAFENWFETDEGWVGLVSLREFYDFIKDDRGAETVINERFLEENVRGYQQETDVNQKITQTLGSDVSPEFWLLNNGITILTPLADPKKGKTLNISDPQVVNGLQTSRKIFEYFNDKTKTHSDSDTRRILVKVIQTDDAGTRDEIIRATNNQNKMPAEALISTYRVQRQIENHLKDNGLYYDRRKGHYKAAEMPAAQIVSVPYLVQAVVSIIVKRPDDARGRPKDYINQAAKRWQVFGTTEDEESEGTQPVAPYDLDVYLQCVRLLRKVDSYLTRKRVDSTTRRNVRFYMARCAAVAAIGNAYFPAHEIMRLDVDAQLTNQLLGDCYSRVHRLYQHGGGNDDAAKNKRMSDALSRSLVNSYSPPNKRQATV